MSIPELNNEDDNSFGDMLKKLDEDDIKIIVQLDVIKRGKRVTTIKGFTNVDQIETTAHQLKKSIGTGGTAKNGVIVLQGDHRTKVTEFLISKGFQKDSIEVI
jgi:translation initiation factor 1